MNNAFTPWFDLMMGHATPLQRAAWFVLGSVEREQRLNLDALTASWLRPPMAWWTVPAPARREKPPGIVKRHRAACGGVRPLPRLADRGRPRRAGAAVTTSA
ncbi:MAG TPA: hypothetical protein VFZ28_18075 [Burkholderiaceae bacterium]|nr:hypothetical protein [Burkholderiaceae bacterium]